MCRNYGTYYSKKTMLMKMKGVRDVGIDTWILHTDTYAFYSRVIFWVILMMVEYGQVTEHGQQFLLHVFVIM